MALKHIPLIKHYTGTTRVIMKRHRLTRKRIRECREIIKDLEEL